MRTECCRICDKKELKVVLDYGNVALADSFLNEEDIKAEKKFPLRLCICRHCKHVQIDDIIDPKLLFEHYVWETGISKSIIKFSQELYENIIGRCDKDNPDILEIAPSLRLTLPPEPCGRPAGTEHSCISRSCANGAKTSP